MKMASARKRHRKSYQHGISGVISSVASAASRIAAGSIGEIGGIKARGNLSGGKREKLISIIGVIKERHRQRRAAACQRRKAWRNESSSGKSACGEKA